MSVRKPVTSSDLRDAASQCASWVLRVDPAPWDKQAYGLEWIRSRTISHIDDALAFYSRSLAGRNTENPGVRGPVLQEGSIEASARQIEAGAEVLVRVSDGTPEGVRTFSPTGQPDAEGFLAMACVEIMVHGYDAVAGTEAEFDPDDGLCRRILGRLFPWAPPNTPGWTTLLWATGRGELEGQDFLGETWVWHNDLLADWEGAVPSCSLWVGRK